MEDTCDGDRTRRSSFEDEVDRAIHFTVTFSTTLITETLKRFPSTAFKRPHICSKEFAARPKRRVGQDVCASLVFKFSPV